MPPPFRRAKKAPITQRSSAVFLTAAHPKMTEGSDIYLGTSIDQIYAQRLNQRDDASPLPSIQLAIEDVGSLSGACGYGYSCVYANTISWASPTQPLPMEIDPRVAFELSSSETAQHQPSASARREADRSILDTIRQELARRLSKESRCERQEPPERLSR